MMGLDFQSEWISACADLDRQVISATCTAPLVSFGHDKGLCYLPLFQGPG